MYSIVLAVLTFSCISIGIARDELAKPVHVEDGWDLFSDVIYETAQVMLLNMSPRLGSNGFISIGRVLAVLLFLFLGIQAVGTLLGDSWQNLLLISYRQHHIVCGLGRIGSQLVRELSNKGEKVVVIELDPANELCHDARERGAIVVIGDATDDEILNHARLKKAKAVYIVTGSDEENIETAVDVQRLTDRPMRQAPPPDCYVHIHEPALKDVLHSSLPTISAKMKAEPFSIMHDAVRHLIVKQLTPVRPRQRNEVALYVVVGFGRMGQTLAANLTEQAHFENRKRARLLILAEDLPKSADTFLSRWSQFSPRNVVDHWRDIAYDPAADEWSCQKKRLVHAQRPPHPKAIEYACNAVFAPLPAYIGDRAFLDALGPLLKQEGVKPAIIVCMDGEHANYAAAVTLKQLLWQFHAVDAPVFVWLPKQEPLKKLLDSQKVPVTPFGSCRDVLRLENVTNPLEETLAITCMATFNGLHEENEKEREELLRRWRADTEVNRRSNRSAATHALIALGCLGMRLIEPGAAHEGAFSELTPTSVQIEMLAEMEHNRWVAERLLEGFSYGERSDQPPLRPQLCTWEVLNQDSALKKEPDKDFRQIKAIFDKLKKLGYKLVKA
ncbi:MAG TPA: NAD-binding protein [Gemmataceae bacterium]|nr:NAD-binding protein [Gemmataceae bacterium]